MIVKDGFHCKPPLWFNLWVPRIEYIQRYAKLDVGPGSLSQIKRCFRSSRVGKSEIGYMHLYPNREVFSIKIKDSGNWWYIEIIKTIRINIIIADTNWIYATYRTFKFGVNLKAQKIRLWENKKGKSIGSDSPLSLDIIQISKMDFERISVKLWWHLVAALPS